MRLLFCFLGGLMAMNAALAIEEPKFKVLNQDAGFELRQYAPFIVAETWVDGDMDAASNKGFRIIADYIFGNNKAPQSSQSSKIAMTAPVTLAPDAQPLKLDMTAPVSLQPAVEASNWVQTQRWRVQFVMPDKYTLESLPLPNNGAVKLREVTAKTVAVAKLLRAQHRQPHTQRNPGTDRLDPSTQTGVFWPPATGALRSTLGLAHVETQ